MAKLTRKVHNLQSIPIGEGSIHGDPTDSELAQRLIRELMDSPRPPADEWGIAPFREIWVLFTRKGETPPTIADELTEDDFHNQWLNAFSLISPKADFLTGYQKDLQNHLGYLYKGDQYIDQKDHILYRIVAS